MTYMKNDKVGKMEMVCLWNLGVLGESSMCSESWTNQQKTMLRCGRRKLSGSLNLGSKFKFVVVDVEFKFVEYFIL